jgi:phospholipid/cholesterol/gamma-HCH transport system permease protein
VRISFANVGLPQGRGVTGMAATITKAGYWTATFLLQGLYGLGDWTLFALSTIRWLFTRRPYARTLLPVCLAVGYQSALVVVITGFFIGMVLAVHSVSQFQRFGFVTWTGSVVNGSVIRELGPVLAATMLAGRVGSAMAAEIATMRVSEQIDALSCLGANPIHYLAVPRFLACVVLIPLLTAVADIGGVVGSALICIQIQGVESHHYWNHSRDFIQMWDILAGMLKPVFFGAAIALISCHRGFRSRAGAEGVGRAATEAFVLSFVAILVIDFFLALFLNTIQHRMVVLGSWLFD